MNIQTYVLSQKSGQIIFFYFGGKYSLNALFCARHSSSIGDIEESNVKLNASHETHLLVGGEEMHMRLRQRVMGAVKKIEAGMKTRGKLGGGREELFYAGCSGKASLMVFVRELKQMGKPVRRR